MSHGLLRAAFRPSADVCVIRAVARQREVLLTEQASWVQRMQKALVQMNIQLTEVISDVMGLTGRRSSATLSPASATRSPWPGTATAGSRRARRTSCGR
jgi:hypothetical protein